MAAPVSVSDLVPAMAEPLRLRPLLSRIRATYSPECVLLFGSRARGAASPDSDWDVLVILPDDADAGLLDPCLGYDVQRGSGVYADILCAYNAEFLSDLSVANSMAREIVGHACRVYTRGPCPR